MNAHPGAIEKFRRTTLAHGVPVSLVPKRCACGRRVFAKQLVQYGACETCVKSRIRA
jgi:hypothetical protein